VSAGTTIASILLLCALVAAGAGLWLKQQQILQREAFQALAARRGWSLTLSEQKLGRPAILRLTARSGRGWHCESRRYPAPDHAMPDYLTTEFVAAEPHWAEGHLVLTPGRPEPAGPDLATPELRLRKSALSLQDRIGLALGTEISTKLRQYPAPAGLTVLASGDPVHRFDLDALATIMADWQVQNHGTDGLPIVQIGPEGFRVQVNYGMRRAEPMEGFIDFALDLIRVI
jgi:hypothetical protein